MNLKPPKTIKDTSTVYQLKMGSIKGPNIFKGNMVSLSIDIEVLSKVVAKQSENDKKSKQEQNNDEIDEEELERYL